MRIRLHRRFVILWVDLLRRLVVISYGVAPLRAEGLGGDHGEQVVPALGLLKGC